MPQEPQSARAETWHCLEMCPDQSGETSARVVEAQGLRSEIAYGLEAYDVPYAENWESIEIVQDRGRSILSIRTRTDIGNPVTVELPLSNALIVGKITADRIQADLIRWGGEQDCE